MDISGNMLQTFIILLNDHISHQLYHTEGGEEQTDSEKEPVPAVPIPLGPESYLACSSLVILIKAWEW